MDVLRGECSEPRRGARLTKELMAVHVFIQWGYGYIYSIPSVHHDIMTCLVETQQFSQSS